MMVSTDSPLPMAGSETATSTRGDATLSLPTVGQDGEEARQARGASVSETAVGDDQNPAVPGVGKFADEIQALKTKLLELEQQANNDPAVAEGEMPRPQLMEDLEEYRRMEACLKNHRREWERKGGPPQWGIQDYRARDYMRYGKGPHPPFHLNWHIHHSGEKYLPPPLTELSRRVADGEGPEDDEPDDDFDRIIDYGSRRDRARKNFEWEMDRIYLAEEIDRRRRMKIIEAKAAKEGQPQDAGLPPPKVAQPRLNRVDWADFRWVDEQEKDTFVVDILVGEPAIDDKEAYRSWFGVSGQARKRDIAQDFKAVASMLPGQAQLPERIRIRSEALSEIMSTILGKEIMDDDFVLIRPFKALVYCAPTLRDWCVALEKRFGSAPEMGREVVDTGDSELDPLREGAVPREPGKASADGHASPEEQSAEGGELPKKKSREGGDGKAEDDDDVTKSPTALEHLKCLLTFIDADMSAKQKYLEGPDCRRVFFSDLWRLFRPGMEVTGSDGKQVYRVFSVTSAKHRVVPRWEKWFSDTGKRKRTQPFSISCVYIDFDGKSLGPVVKVFNFNRFDGERDVTSLEVYPIRFHPIKTADFSDLEWKELEAFPTNEIYRQKLIRRGVKFIEAAGVKHMYYAGPTLEARDEVESQVVIDFETAFSVDNAEQRSWKPQLKTMIGNSKADEDDDQNEEDDCEATCCRRENVHDDTYVDEKMEEEYITGLLPESGAENEHPSIAIIPRPLGELHTGNGKSLVTDDELVIMSYRVFGFVLRSRKWAKLDLTYLAEIHAAERDKNQQQNMEPKKTATAFDRLVLEEWHRPMILSLIAQHFRDKKSTGGQREEFDIVKGKGKGLIILLHGAPGVGKTSTAEGVAEMFKKPLFQITCGDLGTTAEEVEKALETNFALASRWDCILLLDEADVFLAERTKLDFQRNGLVAVFLRVMEYYAGILFLTTNRIGDFDEAFTSRIHVSLYYPDLDDKKTVRVFQLNMQMIRERFNQKGRQIHIDEMGIGGFAAQHFTAHPQARWNGRQIRNACQTALALAEFEAQGNSHEDILRPDAVVTLGVKQFEVVRNAYLEFSRYMNNLYGSNPARRAKEAKVRAIYVDENNNIVAGPGAGSMGMDKAAFRAASKTPAQVPPQQWQSQSPPAQGQHYGYQNVTATYPSYADASHRPPAHADHFQSGSQSWNSQGTTPASANTNTNPPYQGSWEPQGDALARRQPPPAGGQQPQAYPPEFNRGIQAMYTASDPHGAGQLPPGNLPPSGGNVYVSGPAAAEQQWGGAPASRQ
ncbi:hypothetical protein QBC34DRAFT_145978 [Podospora aff. communis PSN243]|uniref:AAA+ ATPase domain-containing protein n=1 Tax=Podospora aff. communis PSN243 TaxID=3040156 RepID=A0AAV9GF60_9PEZI|nr:hypothetical protein QBC34DRAFT_145978 [Podospora aff. communis PSN243]